MTVYYLAIVLALGVAAQWMAWRLRLPSILLLLAAGFALGQVRGAEGQKLFDPQHFVGGPLLLAVVSLSVAVILFEGGMTLRLRELREAGQVVLRLCTIGALVTFVLAAVAVHFLVGMPWSLAAVLGAILVVTGPTVIAPLLRHVRPSRKIGSIVKWEGIVIDPIGAVLAVLVYEAAFAGGMNEAAMGLLTTLLVGVLIGTLTAAVLVFLLKRYWIPDYLHNPLILAAVLLTFTISNHFQSESGLLTVTLLGILLANQRFVSVQHVAEFKENLQVLLISSLFVVLASLLEPQQLLQFGLGGVALLVTLILVVRPASVWLATLGTPLKRSERIFLAALAPRGIVAAAVSSVFGLEIVHAAGDDVELAEAAAQMAPLTFLVIVGTVTAYGLAAAPLARWLKLAEPSPQGILFAGASAWVRDLAQLVQEEGYQVQLVDSNRRNVAAARLAGLPAHSANILSEYAREELELGGIGRLLAVTPNDEVNSLAAIEFIETFGRAGVYQLVPADEGQRERIATSGHLRARYLFHPKATHSELALRFNYGSHLKKTALSSEFTWDDFQRRYGESAMALLLIDEDEKLIVCTADPPAAPKPGQTVIALVEREEKPDEEVDPTQTEEAPE